MSYELKPSVPHVPSLPEKQAIAIGGVDCGECTPSLGGTEVRWHSCIRLQGKTIGGAWRLVQGFGSTPEQAIADSVVRARKEEMEISERMRWLETELGTLGRPDDDIARVVGVTGD